MIVDRESDLVSVKVTLYLLLILVLWGNSLNSSNLKNNIWAKKLPVFATCFGIFHSSSTRHKTRTL